jgi:16S rRNA (guanine527-N7)-methyltransferase
VNARAQQASDDARALAGVVTVSRETLRRLTRLVDLVTKWQRAENLIAPSTLPTIWRRHVADSAQLVTLFPDVRRWIDLGSGAGFPGLVVAILLQGEAGAAVHLIESNSRKCAFLRLAARETEAPAIVHEGRIETVAAGFDEPVEMISARALAPLTQLFGMAEPLIARGVGAAFHKGQDFAREIAEASKSWDFDLVEHRSMIDDSSVILEIRKLARKPGLRRGPT